MKHFKIVITQISHKILFYLVLNKFTQILLWFLFDYLP